MEARVLSSANCARTSTSRPYAVKASGLPPIIRNLDPSNTVLFDRYDEAVAKYLPLEFDHIDGRQEEVLHLIPNDIDATLESMRRCGHPWPDGHPSRSGCRARGRCSGSGPGDGSSSRWRQAQRSIEQVGSRRRESGGRRQAGG